VIYDVAEPITAYRCWKVVDLPDRPLTLTAVSFDEFWGRDTEAKACGMANVNTTWHIPEAEETQVPLCDGPPCSQKKKATMIGSGCGIYCMKTPGFAMGNMPWDGVLGQIKISGRFFPHRNGYRAEKARIVGLYSREAFAPFGRLFGDNPVAISDKVPDIAARYGVRVLCFDEEERRSMLGYMEEAWTTGVLTGRIP
jgi:hypothetical protein